MIDIARLLNNLTVYFHLSKLTKAVKMTQQALDMYIAVHGGMGCSGAANCLDNLTACKHAQGEHQVARTFAAMSAQIRRHLAMSNLDGPRRRPRLPTHGW